MKIKIDTCLREHFAGRMGEQAKDVVHTKYLTGYLRAHFLTLGWALARR